LQSSGRLGSAMKRREFVTLISGAAVWPFAAGAQQKRTHRIGILSQDLQPGLLETFRDELRKRGYVEGTDISIELRNAEGHNERLPALAEELLKLNVDMIVAVNTPAAQAAKKVTKTVPVVMMRVADPVRSGLVESLARPGGNITGLSFMPEALGPKGVELLHEMLPKITRMAALYQGNNPGAVIIIDDVQRKGEQIGLNFVRLPVKGEQDLVGAFETAAKAKAEALFVMDDGAMTERRQRILELAAKQGLPVVSIYRDFAKSGGLIAYGPNLNVVYRRAAEYVDKLIKGATASSLPVEQPVNFYLAVNVKTAKALGLKIPESILVRADEVIE
ncbi:MAG TPA: ABC transporter substrate-binding protein, partial [Pseudolabrys sp.]|nr:ABC transporter substrate-binding protein [Pseudolabrys sp.]